jgi:hypothetical protein
MYASVRQYTLKTGHEQVEEAARDVQKDLGPIIGQAPGFVAYYRVTTFFLPFFSLSDRCFKHKM